jgi:hypothetical protein
MRRLRYLTPLLAVAVPALGILGMPSASADCSTSGASTICSSQGEVRGGTGPSPVPTYDAYQCSDPYLCLYDDYDPLIVIDPDWGIDRPPGGGRPGGGNRPGGGPIFPR